MPLERWPSQPSARLAPERPVPGSRQGPRTSVGAALAESWHLDRRALQPLHALRAVVALAGAMAVGLVTGGRTDAVLAGAGALVVGSASLPSGPGTPVGTTVGAALAVGMSTFVGAATGPFEAAHVAALALWCLAAGMLVVLGPAATTVGIQAVIGMVVFGRFGGPVPASAHLALVVLAGGGAQVVLAGAAHLFGGPSRQRRLVADLYRLLALQASGEADDVAVAEAADAAQRQLASTVAAGRSGGPASGLRSLVDEARRIRVELLATTGRRAVPVAAVPEALRAVAAAVDGRGGMPPPSTALGDVSVAGNVTAAGDVTAALAGQLRAAAGLAARVAGGPPVRAGLRAGRRNRRSARTAVAGVTGPLAAELSRRSPARRHAVRLAVVVTAVDVGARVVGLPHSYWVALTVLLVLKPDYGSTVGRGIGRAAGTAAGVLVAGLLTAAVHPGGAATVVMVAVLSGVAWTTFRANYALFSAVLTAVVVVLLGAIEPAGLGLALDRLADTVIGAGLALAAYAAWPTWSEPQAWGRLADLADAQRRYVATVLGAWLRLAGSDAATVAAAGRIVRTTMADATVVVRRSLAEPSAHRVDATTGLGVLDALHRLTVVAAVLRTSMPPDGLRPEPVWAALRPLVTAVEGRLIDVARACRGDATPGGPPPATAPTGPASRGASPPAPRMASPPPAAEEDPAASIRALQERLVAAADHPPPGDAVAVLLAQTDEMVDAVNTAAAMVGR